MVLNCKKCSQSIINAVQKHPLMTSVIINGIFTTIVLLSCDIRYDTNDDLVMAGIVQGAYGQSNPHTVFINIILGYFLAGMSRIMPFIPWYPVFMYVCLVSSSIVIGYLILKKTSNNLIPISLYLIFLFVFETNLMISPQFTKTAAIMACTGVFLAIDSISRGKIDWGKYIGAVLFIFIGIMYRSDMAFMSAAVTMTYLLYCVTKEKFKIKRAVSIATPVIIGLLLGALLSYAGNRIYLSNSNWAEFEVFQNDRSTLFDYYFFDYGLFSDICDANGLSEENVHHYISTNDFADPDIFTMQAAHELADVRRNMQVFDKFPLEAFVEKVMPVGMIKKYDWFVLSIAIAFLLIILDKRQLIWTAINVVGIVAIEAWLFWNLRFMIERIDISIVFTAVLSSLLIGADYAEKAPKIKANTDKGRIQFGYSLVTTALVCGVLGVSVVHFVNEVSDNCHESVKRAESMSEAEEICSMIENDKEHLYVRSVLCDNPWECANSIWNNKVGAWENSLPLGDWLSYSPVTDKIKENYGISNPYRDIVNSDKVLLLSISANPQETVDYINRNYGYNAELELVNEIGKAKIYSIVTK